MPSPTTEFNPFAFGMKALKIHFHGVIGGLKEKEKMRHIDVAIQDDWEELVFNLKQSKNFVLQRFGELLSQKAEEFATMYKAEWDKYEALKQKIQNDAEEKGG